MDTEERNSVEKGAHRRKAPVPVKVCFAGAYERVKSVPPASHRSSEDSRRPRAQLRPTFACRRKMNTEEPNSVERGTRRRKAPVPVRVCFAGADASAKFVPPTSPRSTEDRLLPRAQLRPTFACRRKTNTEEPNSVEKPAHRRKAPAPVRVCFAGAGASAKFVPPTSLRSPEDRLLPRAQLRPTFACRRKTNTEEHNSVERGAHWRKAPAPVKICFAGAGASVTSVPPPSPCSPEDSIRPRTQLRPTAGNRRTPDHRHHTSCQTAVMGGCHFQAAVLSVKGFVVGSGCGNKKANDNRMQILLVTIPFRRRRNYGI